MEAVITLGEFVAFTLYLSMLVWPSIALGWVVGIFQQGAASMQRINAIWGTEPDIKDDERVRDIKELKGSLRIRRLDFTCPDSQQPVLKNLNLELEAGKVLAVVGRTGSGKTTLVNLLTRTFNPPRGTVFIDGADIREIPLNTLRGHLGYIPQETFLFSDTIRENITFGAPGCSEDEMIHAAQVAQIHDSITEFTNGYDTMLGERGINLSGGQKQRLAIARALVMKPRILLLDDALSAVDTITEEKILGHLREEMRGKTCIWISHRISAIKCADKIIVLDDGCICEEGTHEELLVLNGIYADLFEKQQLEEALALVE